ncbi:hypothetical protein GEOBC_00421 [Geobacteraceae bacterium]|nr:hypothetical protein GEOBC_00421 [Geobacteraceae bacterium]
MTTSEIIVTATIWILTAIGGFFALRGIRRRRREVARSSKHNE